jgi:glutamate/tyrosine decarboxylase-like PLP-dependent enzyme
MASLEWEDKNPIPVGVSESEILSLFKEGIPKNGKNLKELTKILKDVVNLSSYNGHPNFLAYITSSPDPIGVLSDFLASALNQNTNISQISPAASAIEMQTLDWFKEIVGYNKKSQGVFSSGGQFANIIALTVARNYYIKDVRKKGVINSQHRPYFYVSNQSHYCHKQAVELLGFGHESLRLVPVDKNYKIKINKLLEMIEYDKKNGGNPIAIIANVGTVGTGSIDPIEKLVNISKKLNMWLHIDGAYGLPAIISDYKNSDFNFIKYADSIAFDPHKWLYTPLDAGVTLIKEKNLLSNTFSFNPSYLEKKADNENGIIDFIDFTPENSRPFRALKVWVGMHYHGILGYKEMIERDINIINIMAECIKKTSSLTLSTTQSLSIVCWQYQPKKMLKVDEFNKFQLSIIKSLAEQHGTLISKTLLSNGTISLRACSVNFRTTAKIVRNIVKQTAIIGKCLESQLAIDCNK